MATIIDFENNESRLESVEYTLNNITGGGYNYDLSAKSITLQNNAVLILPQSSNIVNNAVGGDGNEYYLYANNLHLIGKNSTLNFIGGGHVCGGVFIVSTNNKIERVGHHWGVSLGGYQNTIDNFNNGGIVIFGSSSTINGENTSNLILGGNAKLNKKMGGNAMLGLTSTINNTIEGNLMCGINLTLTENALSQQNGFLSILSLSADSKQIEEIKNRLGIVFVSAKDTKNGGNLYYSNVLTAPIYVHGYQQYTESANVIDSDGNYLIQNGKSTLEKRIETLEEEIAQLKQLLNR